MEDNDVSVQAVGISYTFTNHPDNESLVTCTVDSRESDPVKVAAIPWYTAGVTAIQQYTYSDSAVVDIECPFQIGQLRELYEFSWDGVIGPGDVQPITNGTVGVYWLAEEDNRTLHVNISAAFLREFQCVGEVRTCQTSSLCQPMERNSPTIMITTTAGGAADLPMITNHPISTTVNEGEVATFSCTVTGHGDLTVEWDVGEVRYNMDNCSPSEICNRIYITNNTGGSVTSTLEVTASLITNSVTCVMKQNLSSSTISFGQPVVGVEIRPPPIRTLRSVPTQLTVIAAPATIQPVTSSDDQSKTDPSEGGSHSFTGSHDIHTTESNSVGAQIWVWVLAGILLSIIISIIILAMSIFAIFCYHFKNKESWLGQRLRQIFKGDPASVIAMQCPHTPEKTMIPN